MKENRRSKKIHATREEGVAVHTNYSPQSNGKIAISAYAINPQTGERLEERNPYKKTAKTEAEIEAVEKILIGRILTSLSKCARQDAPQVDVDQGGIYSAALEALSPKDRDKLCDPNWSRDTFEEYLTYIRRNIIPILDGCGENITFAEMAEIPDILVEQAVKSGKSYGDAVRAKNGTVSKHSCAFNKIYPILRALSVYNLPDIVIPETDRAPMAYIEQAKALPEDVLVRFCSILAKSTEHSLTLGAVLMLTGMLRTSEACAPRFCDIKIHKSGRYAVYKVTKQVQDGETVDALKTKNAYRRIILPRFAVACIQMRKELLLNHGYSKKQVDKMYLTSKIKRPNQVINPEKLSEFVRERLKKAGYVMDIQQAIQAMEENPDRMEDGTLVTDITAYLLRRAGCTLLVNRCGLGSKLVDYLMGHKLPYKVRVECEAYMAKSDNHPIIAGKLERVIYHPQYSASPLFVPIELNPSKVSYSLVGHTGFVLCNRNPNALSGVLEIQSRVPGTALTLTVPRGTCIEDILVSCERFDLEKCEPTIGVIQDREVYDKYVIDGENKLKEIKNDESGENK